MPDPAPRPTRHPVPDGAWDCHAHVFGDYPYRPARPYTPPAAGLAAYRAMLATLGLRHAVIVQPDVYRDNRATEDALRQSNGLWRGIARLPDSVAPAELRRLHALGFRGVRLDARQPHGLAGLEPMAKRIAPLGWHVQLHLHGVDLPTLAPRLAALPVPVVIDHFGRIDTARGLDQPALAALLDLLATGKAWLKLSAAYRFADPLPPYPGLLPFAHALLETAPHRLLWGSDWPHTSHAGFMPDDGTLLDLLWSWAPDPAARTAILTTNPATLYATA